MSAQKRLFIAATRQNDGKSTISLGLLQILKKKYPQIGFMKPVGQHYVEQDNTKVDEDVVLMRDVCGMSGNLKDMNPIVVFRGFTEKYIREREPEKYIKMIQRSYANISKGKELMLIEGTGHAGVGAVFDLSNASVAKLLNCKVLLVSTGGVGKPIDEIVMNKALFDQEGVEVIGVVINKTFSEKYDKIKKITEMGLKHKGIKLLGVIPFKKELTYPTMEQMMEATKAKIICGKEYLQKRAANILVGAMAPRHALNFFVPQSLIIVPGDREDLILSTIAGEKVLSSDYGISGMILTGGLLPHETVLELMERCSFTVLASKNDTYTVTGKVYEGRVKIRAKDKDKVKEAAGLVKTYLDIDEIINRI